MNQARHSNQENSHSRGRYNSYNRDRRGGNYHKNVRGSRDDDSPQESHRNLSPPRKRHRSRSPFSFRSDGFSSREGHVDRIDSSVLTGQRIPSSSDRSSDLNSRIDPIYNRNRPNSRPDSSNTRQHNNNISTDDRDRERDRDRDQHLHFSRRLDRNEPGNKDARHLQSNRHSQENRPKPQHHQNPHNYSNQSHSNNKRNRSISPFANRRKRPIINNNINNSSNSNRRQSKSPIRSRPETSSQSTDKDDKLSQSEVKGSNSDKLVEKEDGSTTVPAKSDFNQSESNQTLPGERSKIKINLGSKKSIPTGPSAYSGTRNSNVRDDSQRRHPNDERYTKQYINMHISTTRNKTPNRPANNGYRTPKNGVKYGVIEQMSESVYKRVSQIGEGTYGKVYKAINIQTKRMVALKRLRMESEKDGFPITAIREIKLLQSLRHPNIVSLVEMMVEKNHVYMVFEYLDHDLAGILSHPQLMFNEGHIKYLFKQITEGLAYMHQRGVLHRDIKGSNILLSSKGVVKIADFGLARSIDLFNPDAHYTNRVITLWYRPPELLLGATIYDGAVDIWGLGCIFAEFFTRKALFQSKDSIGQLRAIYSLMGTPIENGWPEAASLPWYQLIPPKEPKKSQFLAKLTNVIPEAARNLIMKLLKLNPKSRYTADDVLHDSYFLNDPKPTRPVQLEELTEEWHDFEAKMRRKKKAGTSQQESFANGNANGSSANSNVNTGNNTFNVGLHSQTR